MDDVVDSRLNKFENADLDGVGDAVGDGDGLAIVSGHNDIIEADSARRVSPIL